MIRLIKEEQGDWKKEENGRWRDQDKGEILPGENKRQSDGKCRDLKERWEERG